MTTLYHNPRRARLPGGDDPPYGGHSIVQSIAGMLQDHPLTTGT